MKSIFTMVCSLQELCLQSCEASCETSLLAILRSIFACNLAKHLVKHLCLQSCETSLPAILRSIFACNLVKHLFFNFHKHPKSNISIWNVIKRTGIMNSAVFRILQKTSTFCNFRIQCHFSNIAANIVHAFVIG